MTLTVLLVVLDYGEVCSISQGQSHALHKYLYGDTQVTTILQNREKTGCLVLTVCT